MSHADDSAGSRRDFLYYATAGAGVVATSAAVWPLVNQMNPSADVRALASVEVDISGIAAASEPGLDTVELVVDLPLLAVATAHQPDQLRLDDDGFATGSAHRTHCTIVKAKNQPAAYTQIV